MSLYEEIQNSMQKALKAKDADSVRTLRTLLAKLKEETIAKGDDLSEKEELEVIQRAAKQRKESINLYKQGGRDDLATTESNELAIIESYLPKQLTGEELSVMVDKVVTETQASSLNDMGKVMPVIMGQVAGRADGKVVQQLVREKLGQ
ncbi:MAG: GatB/YqeY domain-containing protein [Candidatus Binatia bacterium]